MRFCDCSLPVRVVLLLIVGAVFSSPARAQVWEAPIGGRPIALGDDVVACGPAPAGWALDAAGRTLRPPTDEEAVGRSGVLAIARRGTDCAAESVPLTLVATARWPAVDPASVTFWPDEGRLEARGRQLEGATITWSHGEGSGSDTCRDPRGDGGYDRCTWAAARGASALPAEARFVLWPRGAVSNPGAVLFDAEGNRASVDDLALVPARSLVTRLVATDAAVDLSSGQGEVPLVHPEAVASAECPQLRCEMVNGRLVVRGTPNLVNMLEVRVRLAPHVFVMRKDNAETQLTLKLPVLHCPMTIVSGSVIRGNDDAKLVIQLTGGCARDAASLRFVTEEGPLKVLKSITHGDATYVALRLGRVEEDVVTVSAVRGDAEPIALAVAHAPTRPAPSVRSTLELPGYPNLSFIPNNIAAKVHPSKPGEHQRFALLPIEGVYSATNPPDAPPTVRGDPNAAGLTSLRFGLRDDRLPPGLDTIDLAVVNDPLQRSIDQANLPAPLHLGEAKPLVEVLCGGGKVPITRVLPGVTAHLDYSLRDTCRVVFHRERLLPEFGTQKLHFEVDVLRADGSSRGEAHVSEIVTLRSGATPREAYIRGIANPFDRVVVRLSHEADEDHYVGGSELKTGAPEAQWSMVLGTGRARLYATTTIPTGLYRFAPSREQSGVLSLNFGVISRLTWLDREGHEGFLGAEAGVLVFGLANSQSETGESLTSVGAVLGLGVSVPIANRSSLAQASINLHAWFQSDISRPDEDASRFAFIFGPSISIGNVGLDL